VEQMIDNEAFCRIHNSVLINMHYLESVSLKRNKCTLSTGAELPVSARKKDALRERLYGSEEKTIQQEDNTAHGNKMQETRFKL
jgi:DNA-binding LytR/AlgR family response regulator